MHYYVCAFRIKAAQSAFLPRPIRVQAPINMVQYVIRAARAAQIGESYSTLAAAEKILTTYEQEDREDGVYTPDFYEIVRIS